MSTTAEPISVNPCQTKLDFLWLEITAKCNLKCIHCYADSSPLQPLIDKVTFDDWIRIITEAADLGCRKVQFIGGEPTLYPDLIRLIEHAKFKKFSSIEVYTNGTTLTLSLKECLIDNKVSLAFSMYANDSSVHDDITNCSGSFNKTIDSIKWAVRSNLPVRVGIIELPLNKELTEQTRRMLHELGVNNVGIDNVRGIGRGKSFEDSTSDLVDWQFQQLCGQCSHGKLCVTATGAIFPCVFSRFCTVGDVKYGLAEAIRSSKIRKFGEKLQNVMESTRLGCSPSPSCRPDYPPDPKCNPESRCRPEDNCQPDIDRPCSPNMGIIEPKPKPKRKPKPRP